jgi:hypothetical protein
MPVDCDKVLTEMIKDAPTQAAAIDQSVEQIEEKQAELEEQNQSIRECVTDKARDDLTAYLQGPKLAEIQSLWPEVPGVFGPVYVVFGATYGTIDYSTGNITDWEFRQDNLVPSPPIPPAILPGPPDPAYFVRYVYTPGEDPLIDGWVSDYDFGNDYITHPVGIGAAYGLEPLVDMYEQGKDTLLGNKAKIEASVGVFEKYLS